MLWRCGQGCVKLNDLKTSPSNLRGVNIHYFLIMFAIQVWSSLLWMCIRSVCIYSLYSHWYLRAWNIYFMTSVKDDVKACCWPQPSTLECNISLESKHAPTSISLNHFTPWLTHTQHAIEKTFGGRSFVVNGTTEVLKLFMACCWAIDLLFSILDLFPTQESLYGALHLVCPPPLALQGPVGF